MSLLRPEKDKFYNQDAAINQERRREKEEGQEQEERGRLLKLAEVVAFRIELRRKRRATALMRSECNQLSQELQRSPKRGGPRGNPAEIQQKIADLAARIKEIWPEWDK